MDYRKGRDFSRNLALKENYAFLATDPAGAIDGGEHGFYHRDTRFLSRYRWDFGDATMVMAETPRPDRMVAHYGHIVGHHQLLGIQRRLELAATSFEDRLVVENTSQEQRDAVLELAVGADFADLFEVRGWEGLEHRGIEADREPGRMRWSYGSRDGVELGVEIAFSPAPTELHESSMTYRLTLAPGERFEIVVRVTAESPLEAVLPGVPYPAWRERFAKLSAGATHASELRTSIDDLRALLLFTEHGPVPAAGIPWYVAAFGRDSLLTAHMALGPAPEVAEGTLRYLAAHQGRGDDPFRGEQPGKILHELRFGELSRMDVVPFGPYYGTVDATPLWVMLLHAHWKRTGSLHVATDVRPALDAALAWMVESGDADGDGFLEFLPSTEERGLKVQSWKDSPDSMCHADGSLAQGALAVSEVQGYAFAAYRGAAELYRAVGDRDEAGRWDRRASELAEAFHAAFWLDDLGTYALALDGDKRPLRVHNSDAGQLLWTGIVPEHAARRLAATLMSDENFSGWGIRTLGSGEVRYNPVSYHNGSVWPHDTALIAGGLARYGFREEAQHLRRATFELAASQRDRRPPELVGGYPRVPSDDPDGRSVPPVPYPVACRPQAWDAAALIYLAGLEL